MISRVQGTATPRKAEPGSLFRYADWMGAVVLTAVGLLLYAASGTLGSYFARDDFQWLNDARTVPLIHTFQLAGRAHFYRPMAELWWAVALRGCGTDTSCYHAIELGTHVLNTLLFFYLGIRVFRRRDVAFASALVFVVMPAYVQAVVWVCAVTTMLSAFWYLLCLHLALSASARNHVGWFSVAATGAAAGALYTHESSVTLALTIPLVVWLSPEAQRRWPRVPEILMTALLFLAFGFTTFAANSHNYVFTEGHYAVGIHALGHGLDYIRSLYVGRRAIPDYISLAVAAIIIVAAGNRPMRAGALWMLLTMLPFVSFTWGNVGRYTYLPAMGFAWIAAGVVVAISDALERRIPRRVAFAVAYALLCALVVRFAAFSRSAIAGQVEWMEHYREYALATTSSPTFRPEAGQVVVAPPSRPDVEPEYASAMLKWATGEPTLVVKYVDQ
jgi:hypothetical protein